MLVCGESANSDRGGSCTESDGQIKVMVDQYADARTGNVYRGLECGVYSTGCE